MKKNVLLLILVNSLLSIANAQTDSTQKTNSIRPTLVVGIVVDQMRYDYLYRYWDKLGNGGFKRMLNEGYSFKNANFSYVPTYTAPGHATIYTGTTPAYHGVVANNWFETAFGKKHYCVDDAKYNSVGTVTKEGEKSPSKMFVSTLGDEMKLMNNNHSKVIGIALKDRSSILPGGHKANGAYWLSNKGKWITSSYYMKELPTWVETFNNEKPAKTYMTRKWETVFPISEYEESYKDNNPYEGLNPGEDAPVFPHDLRTLGASKGWDVIKYTPMGNTMTRDFAKAAIVNENLGKDKYTDLLAVSFSATDYIGHFYGPHSVEMQDAIIQLDADLEAFFKFVDKKVGKEKVLYFLTADHGAVNVPKYLMDQKIPAGYFDKASCERLLNSHMKAKFKLENFIQYFDNSQITLNRDVIKAKKLDYKKVEQEVVDVLSVFAGVLRVVKINELVYAGNDPMLMKIKNGYYQGRCGTIFIVLKPGYITQRPTGTGHGSPFSYDTHVPLLFMGAGVKHGASNEKVRIADIAPTISTLINVSFPNGTTGQPLKFE